MSKTCDDEMFKILAKMKATNTKKQWLSLYSKYLKTDHWIELRETIGDSCAWTCQKCSDNKMTQVHHKTYKRLGNESLDDLMGVCGVCHTAIHKAKNKKKKSKTSKKKVKGSLMLRNLIDRVDELEETVNVLMDKIQGLI